MLGFLQQVGGQFGAWFYLIAGGLAFAEAAVMVGLVLPGETALVVAGFAAHQGWIALWPMVGVAVCAAAVGDSVGYELGRRSGPWLRSSRLGRRVGDDRWRRTDDFLRRYGGRAVLLGRFTAGLRALTPGMAGMARMPYLRTFLPWNLAGAAVWGAGCVLLGYGFSASLATMSRAVTYAPLVLIAVAAAVLLLLRLRKKRSPGPTWRRSTRS
ncbi:DedA family protein [Streptomyces sp. SID13031]|uniref:DedA family protein n=1 Tax=Streptomyces sp. SID13031 TaxID=2706046 RepID=UPI0013CA9D58|nr:DedA family protein [Streptomyces sp. SID13031]NEA30741.1 DedA family protein [Streptomyces sp. SID13031]